MDLCKDVKHLAVHEKPVALVTADKGSGAH